MGLLDRLGLKAAEGDPNRVITGTSYNAAGLLPPPPNVFTEVGTARYQPTRDIVPALGNRRQAILTYDQMTNNDASVDVSIRAAKVPAQGATFFVEPFDDKPVNLEIAEFVQFNLLESQNTPWLIALEEILRFYEYGFSIIEPVWELREWAPRRTGANRRRYTMLKKMAPRPASTITDFLYDDTGGPMGVKQAKILEGGKIEEVELPIDKIIVFTFNKKGGNMEGRSLLRTAYKHWYYKDQLYKIDAIQKERHALGIPMYRLAHGYNEKDVAAAWELVRNLRTNEESGMVLPPDHDVEFAKFQGELANVLASIDHHEGRIMLNVMVQFLLLGLQGGGGRATSGSHLDMFHKSLRFVVNLICEHINLYLIPRLVGYNFATAEFPRLQARNIGEARDTQMWASALANLASRNLITLDFETEQWVRQQIDAPLKLGTKQTPEANATSSSNAFGDNQRGGTNNTDPGNGTGRTTTEPGFAGTDT